MLIIDDILNGIEKSNIKQDLTIFCDKMKDQLENKNDRLDDPEILYYYRYHSNRFFDKFLVLSMDIFDEQVYYIDTWEFNKTSNEYKRFDSHTIRANSAKEILLKYATILKNLI